MEMVGGWLDGDGWVVVMMMMEGGGVSGQGGGAAMGKVREEAGEFMVGGCVNG